MFWILSCMNMQTWWSKKGWFVLYIKWKQTLLSVLWLGTNDSACHLPHPSSLSLAKTWGLYHLQGEEDHEARHGGALRRDISSIFLECARRVSCLKRKSCLEIWRSKQIPSECFVGKLRHFLEKLRQVKVQVDEAPEAFDHPTTSRRVTELRRICSRIDCVGWNHLPRLRPFLLRRTKEHQWNLVVYLMSYIIVIYNIYIYTYYFCFDIPVISILHCFFLFVLNDCEWLKIT